jgi:hypothetical protein
MERLYTTSQNVVPKQNSSGGKDISKQGDRYLRSLFTAGALAVIRYAKIHGTGHREPLNYRGARYRCGPVWASEGAAESSTGPGLLMLAVWSILYGACLGVQSALGDRVYSSSISEVVVCELRLGYWWSMTIPQM